VRPTARARAGTAVSAEGDARGWYPTTGPHFLVARGGRGGPRGDHRRRRPPPRGRPARRTGRAGQPRRRHGRALPGTRRPRRARPRRGGLTERTGRSPPRPVAHRRPGAAEGPQARRRRPAAHRGRRRPPRARPQRPQPGAPRRAKAAKAVARWRAVAHAAAKQSRRVRPLEVADVGEWADAFAERRRAGRGLLGGGRRVAAQPPARPADGALRPRDRPGGRAHRLGGAGDRLPVATLGPTDPADRDRGARRGERRARAHRPARLSPRGAAWRAAAVAPP
jgi:hypothetical protein